MIKIMDSDLSQHINIGRELERKLIEVGVRSFADLKRTGSEHTFLRLRAVDQGACLSLLYALDGAIAGTRWYDLSPERKVILKRFYQMIQKS